MKNLLKNKFSLDAQNEQNTKSGAGVRDQITNITAPPGDICNQSKSNIVPNSNLIQNTLHQLSQSTNYGNITITNSSNAHLGNKINYNGDLNLNLVNNNNNETGVSLIQYGNNKQILINSVSNIYISRCSIFPRSFWSIKTPKEKYAKIKEPVRLVIISHTATKSSTSQSENIQLIRVIQAFHVDTHQWNDIGYNFLVGCDGNIYEGRGWGIEGAHTFGYNNQSIGIAFIGCFINKMPTEQALNACKNLIERGVAEGHISKDYKLLGHRQCSPTESPGTKLYEEITKWEQFYNKTIDEDLRSDDYESAE